MTARQKQNYRERAIRARENAEIETDPQLKAALIALANCYEDLVKELDLIAGRDIG